MCVCSMHEAVLVLRFESDRVRLIVLLSLGGLTIWSVFLAGFLCWRVMGIFWKCECENAYRVQYVY